MILRYVLLVLGSLVITVWGIAHLFPTKSIVKGVGSISLDNRRIITMEWIVEGLTLCFIGVLVLLVTSFAGGGGHTWPGGHQYLPEWIIEKTS